MNFTAQSDFFFKSKRTFHLFSVQSKLSTLFQFDVREANLRDGEQRTASVPGQPVCVFSDVRACVFCDGVHGRGRPDDAHTR